jgi:Flp pilus assembly protein TadB
MPTRKQKRRREKDRRHEYEYVYVDESGQEVEVDETEAEAAATSRPAKDQKPGAKGKPKATGRTLREPPEPSWSRSVRRAVPWQIGIVVVMVLLLRSSPLASRLLIALIYGALFIPLMYMTDRMVRNRWLKQQARVQQPKDGGSKGQRGPR